MVFYWVLLIFFIVLMAIAFGVGYVRQVARIGREAVRRIIRSNLPGMLLGLAPFLAPTLAMIFLREYSLVIFQILYSVGVSVWLLPWFFRKKEFGNLLINIEQPLVPIFFFWMAVFLTLITGVYTFVVFGLVLEGLLQSTSLGIEISRLVFGWVLAIFFLAYALSRIEFRENGICFVFTLFKWQRINSYNWEQSKPNILTIRFKPRFPLSRGFMSMPIPAKHRDVVNQILDERLPGKNL
jgi:hypothetical protein